MANVHPFQSAKFKLNVPKPKPKTNKLAKAASDKTQTELPNEMRKREQMFSVALEVIDNHEEMETKVDNLVEVNDITTFRREFARVMIEVFRNIVPKTMPMNLRTDWNQYGMNRWGVARRSRHSNRYDSDTIFDLVGYDSKHFTWHADLDEQFKYTDKGDELPKEYKELDGPQMYLKNAIELLQKSKFRTRKRSLEKLKRVQTFMKKHGDLLKMKQDDIRIPVGECFYWNGNRHYYGHMTKPKQGFVKNDFELLYRGRSRLQLVTDDGDEFELGYAQRKLDHAFAFANIYPKFDEFLKAITKVKEERGEIVEKAIADLRKTFARELLVAKAKQISN